MPKADNSGRYHVLMIVPHPETTRRTGGVASVLLMLAVLMLASACGGGGGRVEPQTTDSPTPQTTDSPTTDPQTPQTTDSPTTDSQTPQTTDSPTPQTTEPPPPEDRPPPCIRTATNCLTPEEYARERDRIAGTYASADDFTSQYGLEMIGADKAWAHLELALGSGTEPGAGQTVGMIDSGIGSQHPVFLGKRVIEDRRTTDPAEDGSTSSHGTSVASIMVARRDALRPDSPVTAARGVAYGADITVFSIGTGSAAEFYTPISLAALSTVDSNFSALVDHAVNWSASGRTIDFVNMSIGYPGIIDQYSAQDLRTNLGRTISSLAQASTDKTIFVWSAGNAHGSKCRPADFNDPRLCTNLNNRDQVFAASPSVLAGLPARIPEVRNSIVSVVSVDENGDISWFSNRCGIAADWCIAAPGEDILVAYWGPINGVDGRYGIATGSGTSYAAPMVTGSLVVMKHYFRDQLGNTQLLARLLETADRTGKYADSTVYGRGLLDLAAATSPVGATTVALGTSVTGPGAAASDTLLTLGHAFGDGLTRSLSGIEMTAFDDLGAPFWFSFDSFIRSADGPSAAERLRRLMEWPDPDQEPGVRWSATSAGGWEGRAGFATPRLGLLDTSTSGMDGGHLSLADDSLALSLPGRKGFEFMAFSTEGLDRRSPVSGSVLSWRPEGSPLGLKGGWADERETLLGSRPTGAFGFLEAGFAFVGIEGGARVGTWHVGGSAEIGTADTTARSGLITDLSTLTTSAFALHAARPLDEGEIALQISQPLRAESGRARLSVPVGRTPNGGVTRRTVMADLEPSGRQMEVAVQWRRPLAYDGELRLKTVWTRNPGHDATADSGLTLLAGLRYMF